MARNLTIHFLQALKTEFRFLENWAPEIHSAERPVEFLVQRQLPKNTIWELKLGRYNNAPDNSYHVGVTTVFISNGASLKKVILEEGKTSIEDIIEDDTKFVLIKESYQNFLTRQDCGNCKYILYKRAEEVLAEIKKDTARDAAFAREELEVEFPNGD